MKMPFKQITPYLFAVVAFYLITIAYFAPAVFKNKSVMGGDVRIGYAVGADLREYTEHHPGEKSLWASRMFSGMPSYQMTPNHATATLQLVLRNVFEGGLPTPAGYIFALMLGFFILLCCLKVNPYISIVGSVAYAFSSYFFILIPAGHIWKIQTLELIAPTIAGIVLAYRGKYLIGGAVTALFFSLQLFSNHPQMTYYFMLLIGLLLLGYLVNAIMQKWLKQFTYASVAVLVAIGLGFTINSTNLILSSKYSAQTIRAPSELSSDQENKTTGLDKKYATQWSYGIDETFTLLVPNTRGGASEPLGIRHLEQVEKNVDSQLQQVVAVFSSYFGDQPFTAGPVYVGAFIIFLFVFGLFVVKGYLKWVMLAGTLMSIMLAWGYHFMWLTDLFLDYFPVYNKFRTVSSILVVAEFCIPLLAILALVKVVENPKIVSEQKRALYISLGLTAGLALLFALVPKIFFKFPITANDQYVAATYAKQYPNVPSLVWQSALDRLEEVRVAIFRNDAWRSFLIITGGAILILLYGRKKIKKSVLITGIGVLVLFDMGGVNKRYINNDSFVAKAHIDVKALYPMTEADRYILQDTDPNYRVLNLTVDPFNDGQTSYFHKSIGGYHAAKLRRYQDVIEGYLGGLNMNVLNMLNTRYVIMADNQGVPHAQRNPDALGHAWFVDTIQWVNSADEEFAALEGFSPVRMAIIDKCFESQLSGLNIQPDTTSKIEFSTYEINDLCYTTQSQSDQLAVFSEIYYDDGLSRWDAYVDGQPVSVIRVDYLLRAIRVPAGQHSVEFKFKPQAYKTLNNISLASMWLMLILVVVAFGVEFRACPSKQKTRNV